MGVQPAPGPLALMEFRTFGTVPRPCPKCLALHDAETQLGKLLSATVFVVQSGSKATDGDVTVCSECGEILIMKTNPTKARGGLTLTLPTPADLRRLRQNTTQWRLLQKLSHELREFHKWNPPPPDEKNRIQ